MKQTTSKLKFSIKLFCILLGFSVLCGCAKQNDFNPDLKNKQDATAYLNPKTENSPLISAPHQKQLFQQYLKHYYSPWTGKDQVYSRKVIKKTEVQFIQVLIKNPGWNENTHQHTKKWAQSLMVNMEMNSFPNHIQRAITINADNLRRVPTIQPSFSSVAQPGSTYPFDNLQSSYVSANLPVEILQTSKNGAWNLVLTNYAFGWMASKDLAFVNPAFIRAWHTKSYLAFSKENIPVSDKGHLFRFSSRLGDIYPLEKISANRYEIELAVSDTNRNGIIKMAEVNKQDAFQMPLAATPKNIALLANQLIGGPYGWGGMYGFRDCSATSMNLFAGFGIWLPRNSTLQAEIGGKLISLKNLSNQKKIELIKRRAIPFLTLLHIPGHIMIYLGEKDNHLYVLQDMWGLRTMRLFRSAGRAVVGSTVITPITLGKGYINVEDTPLDRTTGIVLLGGYQR